MTCKIVGGNNMILVGRNRSPFSRRVAVSLRLLGFDYEHLPFTTWSNFKEVRKVNPVGRVPALILDDGETLIDSGAILDYLDQLAGPARALVPMQEPQRHHTLKIIACAMGALEKFSRLSMPAQCILPKNTRTVGRA